MFTRLLGLAFLAGILGGAILRSGQRRGAMRQIAYSSKRALPPFGPHT